MKQSLSRSIKRLKLEKHRITKARSTILEILFNDMLPHDATELNNLLAKKGINVNKTTIYRELDFLTKYGFVRQIFLAGNRASYEISQTDCHHHVLCSSCGKVTDVVLKEKNIIDFIEKATGYKISNHAIEFSGLCDKCMFK